MWRAASPSATAVIHLCAIPAPAPCANTRQARESGGASQSPDTVSAPATEIVTASLFMLPTIRLYGDAPNCDAERDMEPAGLAARIPEIRHELLRLPFPEVREEAERRDAHD